MGEHDVNYASVIFKANKHPPPEASAKREEETVYDEVKVQNETAEQIAITNGFSPDKKANGGRQRLACCLGILCVFLLLGIITVCVYFVLSKESDRALLDAELKENQAALQAANEDLKKLNNKLSSDIKNLRSDLNNLTVQLSNLTLNYTVLESELTNLTTQNQQLQTQRNNLTEQITNMETNWINLNFSRAQWSVEAYCPKVKRGRQCKACQKDWELSESSCYAYNNPEWFDQKTWEEARKDCRGKGSDLAVAHNEQEKDAISFYSKGSSQTDGYWIGLRAEGGKWKWVDGSELTQNSGLGDPTDGRCVISVKNRRWKSESCDEKQRWICQMDALSV